MPDGTAAPNPVRKLSSSRLIQVLNEIENPAMLIAAQAAGRMIRSEQGLETAIELIEQEKARFSLKNPNL